MAFADNGVFAESFRGNQHSLPIVGGFENQQRDGVKVIQATLSTQANAGVYSIASPVVLTNGEVQDPHVPLITQLATTDATIAGFILRSATDIIFTGGTAPVCINGYSYSIGLIGSGVETWLPCDATLLNFTLTNWVTWDFANHQLKTSSAQSGLEIFVLSAPVQGIAVDYTQQTPVYKQQLVIKVQL